VRKILSLTSLLLAATLLAPAQQPAAKSAAHARTRTAATAAQPEPTASLPVTRVSLYKNGVGFFEHDGHVTGNQSVSIDFTTAQLNDVLQSLTAIDLNGGRIAGAGYNSTTPLDQQLKSLPLALNADASAVDFYNAIRGARVEVRAPGIALTGRLLNIESVEQPHKDGETAAEKRLITVIGDAGADSGVVRTIELTPATSVRLLDTDLHTDVSRYLQLLASTRNQGLRHLTLEDNGTGSRELHVSYISEVPIWKSTYRILFTEPNAKSAPAAAKQTATLQGWSVVDNTTGADWINIQLSLIAGAPQSFIQPLSVPYYSRRPEIPLPQEAQLTPQTHESGELQKDKSYGGMGSGSAGGITGGMGGGLASLGVGLGPGVAGNYGGGLARSAPAMAQNGRFAGSGQTSLNEDYVQGIPIGAMPPPPPPPYEQSAANSIAARSTTSAFDDYFAYNLTEPITIRKNESALVPILQTKIDAERVTLWTPRQPTPLRALWITNTSNLTLDRGSFSIVEDGNFGGEGLLDPIHPAEKRLLSYAVDQAVHISTESASNSTHATTITAAKGVLTVRQTQIAEITYVVRNAAPDARTVILEHPIRTGYTLDSDPKPEETTPTLYRFRVKTAPGETVRLHVGERRNGALTYQLTNFNDSLFTFILNQSGNSAAIRQALQPILDARRKVADMQQAVDKADAALSALRSDEERQRSNITALANADKASRQRFVHDLNATEDQIAAAQKNLNTAQANLQAAKDALAAQIEALQLDEKL
jgi:hypothetical protein